MMCMLSGRGVSLVLITRLTAQYVRVAVTAMRGARGESAQIDPKDTSSDPVRIVTRAHVIKQVTVGGKLGFLPCTSPTSNPG